LIELEETLKQILNELKNLKEGQDRIEVRVDKLDGKVDKIEEKVDKLELKVDTLSSELRSNFKFINDKLDEHRKVFEVVSDEIKGVKVDIEYLSSKTGRHDMELNNIISKLRG
jgi:chromosome segregation ATPase